MDAGFEKFVNEAFFAILAGGVTWSSFFLSKISQRIGELNTRMGTIVEKISWHEKEIETHDQRISKLESKRRN